ncbi:MAG: NAD(P)-dependent oxidoreductase [Deltaproteobacteria bacterium]|nr:NAD(P)-dependent oxidoreductase [Deltaproteobacteria bacterium]MBZ0218880.1 NAD(P)-dependent oxidoreductase [Deltaproteobacteria bacterium]
MGKAIATRLKGQGVEVHAWNRTLTRARELDVIVSDTPAALASRADIIFVSLFDSASVREVLSMNNGLLSGELRGKLVVDMTTNHFKEVLAFHSILAERGGAYLEAPLIGSVIPAMSGSLTILASGGEDPYKAALPYLEKLGSAIYFLKEPGLATRIKLVNNLLLGTFMASIAEATALGEKAGLDRATALDIFSNGAGSSAILSAKKEKLLNEDFEAHFKCSLMYKDLHYLQDLAAALKSPVFTASIAKELFAAAVSKGAGEEDFSAVYRAVKNL